MDRNEEVINTRYDALMFARTAEAARSAAKLLIQVVLGEAAEGMQLERALREVCRKIRPASDPRDQARFEAEFVELAIAPSGLQGVEGGNKAAAEELPSPKHSRQMKHRVAA